ncbi:MAG: AAA family ATPase [Chloroflexales bacterium]|nr:AAA family ATPase [Chloroflexales bacterium]
MHETLATKLLRPPSRPALVDRARLLAQIDAAPAPALVVVAAPAGFGKSTLVGAWAARQGAAGDTVAWLTLDEDDSDVARLLAGLLAAIRLHQPGVGDAALALLRASQPVQPRAVLTALINDLAALGAPLALVLDDYHRVTSQAPHAALAFLIDQLPPGMRLVIISRSDPPLPLARWRARGLLVELRADDLRFTHAETSAFFTDVMQIGLTPAQVAALEARTEGWAAGLQLAALSLRGRADPDAFIASFTGSNRFVLQYLATEVLGGLPAHLRDFLLRTSVLQRLSGELCDAVLGLTPEDARPPAQVAGCPPAGPGPRAFERSSPSSSYSGLVLAELEQRNIFVVPLDDEHHWYRYHHLFADVLRARLASGASPAEVAALHHRASAWCEGHGLLEEAVVYALAGSDDEWTGRLILRAAPRLLLQGEFVTLLRWITALPEPFVRARPDLAAHAGWASLIYGRYAEARAYAQSALAAYTPDTAPGTRGIVLGLEALLLIHDQAQGALLRAEEALGLLGADDLFFRCVMLVLIGAAQRFELSASVASRTLREAVALSERLVSPFLTIIAKLNLSTQLAISGQLREAETILRGEILAPGAREPRGHFAFVAHTGIAPLLYERDDLDGAEESVRRGLEAARLLGLGDRIPVVHQTLARVRYARGDRADAIRLADEILAELSPAQPELWRELAALRAAFALAAGDLVTARAWAEQSGIATIAPDDLIRCYELTVYARLLWAVGRPQEAMARLDTLIGAAEAVGMGYCALSAHVLQAQLRQAAGEAGAAEAHLAAALKIAAPEGYRRTFLDEGPAIVTLLEAHRARHKAQNCLEQDFVGQLLAAFAARRPISTVAVGEDSALRSYARSPQRLPEPLSERELEVLRLVATGTSNSEIAEQLVVSVGTVKKHINNIFGKLGATHRAQAIAVARQVGLIP